VFDITESEDTQKSLVPSATLSASISQAHGVADVNCVAWAPRSIAQDALTLFPDSLASASNSADGTAAARFQEIQEDEAGKECENEDARNRKAGGHPYMCDLLASAGDDGIIKVWTLDGSSLAPSST
jgi:cytosolic iron-sulfur protein assembly protein CIAO1